MQKTEINPTVGEKIMQMKKKDRRCPKCGGEISYQKGCRGRLVPECKKCDVFFPRGAVCYAQGII